MNAAAALDKIAGPEVPASGGAAAPPELRLLDELAGYGCDIARAIAQRVQAADPAQPVAELQAAGMAYARVARAVRLTLMLKAKLADKPAPAGAEAKAGTDEAGRRNDPEHMRKFRVERIIERVARARHPGDEDAVDRLMTEAGDRLDDDDLYGGVLERPISELLALICGDLGLPLDWSRLAEEAWARQEIAAGQPGWPLADRAAHPSPRTAGEDAMADDPAAATNPRRTAGGVPPPLAEGASRRDTG